MALPVAFLIFMPWAVGTMRDGQRKTGSGGAGWALLEMQAFVAPSTEHLIEAQQEKVVEVAGDSDPDEPQPDLPDVTPPATSG